jgi:hypothetical protein
MMVTSKGPSLLQSERPFLLTRISAIKLIKDLQRVEMVIKHNHPDSSRHDLLEDDIFPVRSTT